MRGLPHRIHLWDLGQVSVGILNQASGALSASAVTAVALPYYHQFTITFGYRDQDSIAVTSGSPIGSYYQFGTPINIAAGSSYGLASPASAMGRCWQQHGKLSKFHIWHSAMGSITSPMSFTVASSTAISDSSFYHQYQVSARYANC